MSMSQPPQFPGQQYPQSPYAPYHQTAPTASQDPFEQMYGSYLPEPPYPLPPKPANGLAIAALITGILALPVSFFPYFNIAGIVLGVTALILGIIALKKQTSKPLSIVGVVLGAVATVISAIILTLALVEQYGSGGAANQVNVEYSATVSSGDATVRWGNSLKNVDFTSDWSTTQKVSTSAVMTTMTVTASDPEAVVTCTITVEGKTAETQSDKGTVGCAATVLG